MSGVPVKTEWAVSGERALWEAVGLAIVVLLLVRCSVAQPVPTATSVLPTATVTRTPFHTETPDLMSTLVAKGPVIEVTFYGKTCTVRLPTEIRTGDQGVVFNNLSDAGARMHVARHHPGVTWEDVLDNIGTPFVDTPVARGSAVLQFSHLQIVDSDTNYRQYEFEFEGEYHIVVEAQGAVWPCGPFYVVAAP